MKALSNLFVIMRILLTTAVLVGLLTVGKAMVPGVENLALFYIVISAFAAAVVSFTKVTPSFSMPWRATIALGWLCTAIVLTVLLIPGHFFVATCWLVLRVIDDTRRKLAHQRGVAVMKGAFATMRDANYGVKVDDAGYVSGVGPIESDDPIRKAPAEGTEGLAPNVA